MIIIFEFYTRVYSVGGLRGWRVVNTQSNAAVAKVVNFGRRAPRGHRTEPTVVAAVAGSHPSAVVVSAYDGSRRHRRRRRTRSPSTATLRTHCRSRARRPVGRHSCPDFGEHHLRRRRTAEDADFNHGPATGDHQAALGPVLLVLLVHDRARR